MKEKFAERISEETVERIGRGCFLGLILFTSTMVYWCSGKNIRLIEMKTWLVGVMLICYLLLGNLIFSGYAMPKPGRFGKWLSSWMKGVTILYVMFLPLLLLGMFAAFIPEVIRYTFVLNLTVLVLCWLLDYSILKRIAGELNQGRENWVLIVDLEECPKTEEAFCEEIEKYCAKNHQKMEYIHWGKPADIKMDGEEYHVELDFSYSGVGPAYALKFIRS